MAVITTAKHIVHRFDVNFSIEMALCHTDATELLSYATNSESSSSLPLAALFSPSSVI